MCCPRLAAVLSQQLALLALVGGLERAQVGVHRHLRVDHDVALRRQVHDQIGAQPAPVGVAHADLRDEVDVLGHVRRRDAVAQLHLAPRAADLRALEGRDERPGLPAQARELRVRGVEHLPHLTVRHPPVALELIDLAAHAAEVLRDRVEAALDLLRALAELGVPLGARHPLHLLGDLPQRVGGDRLHLRGELLRLPARARRPGRSAQHRRDDRAADEDPGEEDCEAHDREPPVRRRRHARALAGEVVGTVGCGMWGLPCSQLSLRGEPTSMTTYREDRRQ